MNMNVRGLFACADNEFIEFAIKRARLNDNERRVLTEVIDHCKTQEETAEIMDISVRQTQNYWYSANEKLLSIPWVTSFINSFKDGN